MSNDQSLPRPNFPQPPSIGGSQGSTASPLVSDLGQSATPSTIQTSSTPPPTPLASTSPSASPQALTQVSGLDPQSPGGPPPQLNDQGQVISTSMISKTQQAPSFDQPVAPPESTLQKMQAAGVNQAGQGKTTVGSLGVSGQTAVGRNQASQQAQPQANVSSQQTIGFIQDAPQEVQGNIREADKKQASNLGVRLPGMPGAVSTSSPSSQKESDKSDPKKSKKTKETKAASPKAARPASPVIKYVLFAAVAIVIVGGVIFGISRILGGDSSSDKSPTASKPADSGTSSADQTDSPSSTTQTKKDVVLSYWGLWEPESVLEEIFKEFEKETGIGVDYRQQSHKDYRTRLQTAISEGNGPDIFRYHATWVPMLKDDLAVLPTSVMSASEYEKTFYPIMVQQLQINGQIIGIPLMYDGLGLYYNKDILQTANEQVPSTWGELRVLAEKLTVRDGTQVQRGGVALGNTTNVEHFADILGLLIYQNGGDPTNPVSGEVRDAIDFYVLFGKDKPMYGTNLPSSTVAFARGEVAMMLAPSWRAHEVLHINPELDFEIAPVPKLGTSEFGWATYWAEGVSSNSQYKQEAWQLLSYLSSKEVLRKLYSAQSEIRAFGEIYPRQDMAEELAGAKYVSSFLEDAKQVKSGPICSYTHDAGLNDNIIEYYEDAVNSASTKNLTDNDIQALGKGVGQVLNQY